MPKIVYETREMSAVSDAPLQRSYTVHRVTLRKKKPKNTHLQICTMSH